MKPFLLYVICSTNLFSLLSVLCPDYVTDLESLCHNFLWRGINSQIFQVNLRNDYSTVSQKFHLYNGMRHDTIKQTDGGRHLETVSEKKGAYVI